MLHRVARTAVHLLRYHDNLHVVGISLGGFETGTSEQEEMDNTNVFSTEICHTAVVGDLHQESKEGHQSLQRGHIAAWVTVTRVVVIFIVIVIIILMTIVIVVIFIVIVIITLVIVVTIITVITILVIIMTLHNQ